MFRKMRRNRQELSVEECLAILERGTCGVLAVSGDEGYPYAVPISYVYDNEKIYFHSAVSGHKIDALSRNDKVSFCVVDQDRIVPEEYTTCFRSVIAFGTLRILSEEAAKRSSIEKLALKYAPADKCIQQGPNHRAELGSFLYAGNDHRAHNRKGSKRVDPQPAVTISVLSFRKRLTVFGRSVILIYRLSTL